MRKVISMLMAVLLVMSIPMTALAIEVDPSYGDVVIGNTEVNHYDADGERTDAHEGEVTIKENGEGTADGTVSVDMDSGKVEITGDVDGGIYAGGDAEVTVNGDVSGHDEDDDWYSTEGIEAEDSAKVTVNGNVSGGNGNPVYIDMDDPYGFSDGGDGIEAEDNAVVTVTGDVTGGESFGTYGYGGYGIFAEDNATVNVGGDVIGGDVTANPDTEAIEDCESYAGEGIYMSNSASVAVGGNVTGGNTNGDQGNGGFGVIIESIDEESGSLYIEGDVTAGTAENGTDGTDILIYSIETEDFGAPLPEMTIGSYDSIGGIVVRYDEEADDYIYEDMTDEELEAIKAEIKTIEEPEEEPETVQVSYDSHYGYLFSIIRHAKAGEEVTTDVGARKYIPSAIIDAAREAEITLIIKWTGGDDLVITKDFTEELHGDILLTDLAEMLKK